MKLHIPSSTRLVSYVLFLISFAILGATAAYTLNVRVLANWQLILPKQPIHAGDPVTIQSSYTKLRPVTGVASRYLDCKNESGAIIRYPINQATADHAPGTSTGTGVVVQMPTTIPDLPADCRFSINIRYPYTHGGQSPSSTRPESSSCCRRLRQALRPQRAEPIQI